MVNVRSVFVMFYIFVLHVSCLFKAFSNSSLVLHKQKIIMNLYFEAVHLSLRLLRGNDLHNSWQGFPPTSVWLSLAVWWSLCGFSSYKPSSTEQKISVIDHGGSPGRLERRDTLERSGLQRKEAL